MALEAFILLLSFWLSHPCHGQSDCVTIPGHDALVHAAPGDVDIGVLTFGRDFSQEYSCGKTVTAPGLSQVGF